MSAEGSQHSLAIVEEDEYGVTPDAPAFMMVRHTGATLQLSKTTNESNELRDDRQKTDVRHGAKSVTGDINFELSYGGAFDLLFQSALQGVWAEDALSCGTTRKSFTIERCFANAAEGGGNLYQVYRGCEVNTLNLSVQPNGIVTGTFGIMGMNRTLGSASVASEYIDAPETPVFDAFSGEVTEGQAALDIATELSLSLDNGLAAKYAIGNNETLKPNTGRSNATGQLTLYYDNNAILDKFDGETESQVAFRVGDGANFYAFEMNRIKYNGAPTDVTDESAVTVPMPFQALRSRNTKTNLTIRR